MPIKSFRTKGLLLVLFVVIYGFSGADFEVNAAQYATSKQPYWKVGVLNLRLSTACRNRKFNQIKAQRLNIGFLGARGQGVTGIAKQNYNLYDPLRLGKPKLTYHFFNDGYSNCRVFVVTG